MREQQQYSTRTQQSSNLTADERIDLALSRAYAVLLRAADKARAAQQQEQGQQEDRKQD